MIGKKIVVLSSHTPSLFWFRMDMMREFARRGCRVYALGNEEEAQWRDRFSESGICYRQIPVRRNGLNPLQDFRTFSAIRRELREIRPDGIFCFQAKTVIYGSLAAKSLGIREIYPLIAGLGSVFLGVDPKSSLVRAVMTRLYRASLRACPAVFFQNRDDEALFRARKMLRKEKSVLLRGSGVNLDHFAPKPLPEEPAFLCIARLIRDKGVGEYLQACRIVRQKYPSVPCLLLGPYDSNPSAIRPEELRPYLEEQVVTYCGEQEDVRPYLERCSVFVLPSYREGTPKTVLEAMATGRAILTTDTVGCRETVREGENGFLVPVKDASALAERMCWFLEHSEEIPRLAENGRRMAEELFDVRKVNASICETMGLDELSPERKDCL